MGLAAPAAGDLEAVADLDALHRLDAHQRLGQQAVELAVPVHVAAEPDRHAVGQHLDDAAERVAVLGRRLDLVDHRRLGLGVEAAHLGRVDRARGRPARGGRVGVGAHRPELDHVARRSRCRAWPSSALASAPAATRAAVSRAEARSSTSRASVEAVLLHAGQVGVAGAGLGERLRRSRPGAGDISSVHLPLPLAVADLDGHRRAEGAAVADAAEEGELVLLEPHAGAAAVAEPAAGQLVAGSPRR